MADVLFAIFIVVLGFPLVACLWLMFCVLAREAWRELRGKGSF